ncbi:hypothetical protein FGO68_gene10442 [Halteria grandinella]|uniref:Uncharacterized protein n=1 Tax=Halteria grandinella TaxID=5974 RepID=A0A8J8SVG8_HALGN|nr:hypothetical protein FGO68_gene10442 [Halteria grandinella]
MWTFLQLPLLFDLSLKQIWWSSAVKSADAPSYFLGSPAQKLWLTGWQEQQGGCSYRLSLDVKDPTYTCESCFTQAALSNSSVYFSATIALSLSYFISPSNSLILSLQALSWSFISMFSVFNLVKSFDSCSNLASNLSKCCSLARLNYSISYSWLSSLLCSCCFSLPSATSSFSCLSLSFRCSSFSAVKQAILDSSSAWRLMQSTLSYSLAFIWVICLSMS